MGILAALNEGIDLHESPADLFDDRGMGRDDGNNLQRGSGQRPAQEKECNERQTAGFEINHKFHKLITPQ